MAEIQALSWCFFQKKKNLATGGEIQGEEKDPHPLARYVHPPLVKPETVYRRQHGHSERVWLESAGGKKREMKVSIGLTGK